MVTIEIRSLSYVSEIFPAKRFAYDVDEGTSVHHLLKKLDAQYSLGQYIYDEKGALSDNIRIILRGRDVRFMRPEEWTLKESDIVLVMPILAGG